MGKYLLSATLLLFSSVCALAQDLQHGEVLARRWCASCHMVDAGAATGRSDSAPSFPAIAARPATTAQSLKARMTVQHGQMPDLSLTNAEEADLSAYILSLRKR